MELSLKKNRTILASLFIFTLLGDVAFSFAVKSSGRRVSKTSCVVSIGGSEEAFRSLGKILAFDMGFSGQFKTSIRRLKAKNDIKSECADLFEKGVDLHLKITPVKTKSTSKQKARVEVIQTWLGKRAYSKTIEFDPKNAVRSGHTISASVLKALTGKRGVCQSTLAWCQDSSIYCADYGCMEKRVLVNSPGTKFALSFHTKAPLLFFSQATENNNELSSVDLSNFRERVRFSYPGLTMQFSPSKDGTKGVVCMSGSRGNTELYLYDQSLCNKLGRQAFQQLTKNGGTNASPCFLPNGDVVFCSDFQTGRSGRPQLFYLDMKGKRVVRITDGRGYCAAPSYCEKKQKIVFNKAVDGVFQLFSLDLKGFNPSKFIEGRGLRAKRLTFDRSHKTEPQWHPDGDFVAFVRKGVGIFGSGKAQIAVLNLIDDSVRIVTRGTSPCGFPAWTNRTLY
ncbi:TolB family protein [Candidatus Dependentiae bacterium]